jgi:hypothetical protein
MFKIKSIIPLFPPIPADRDNLIDGCSSPMEEIINEVVALAVERSCRFEGSAVNDQSANNPVGTPDPDDPRDGTVSGGVYNYAWTKEYDPTDPNRPTCTHQSPNYECPPGHYMWRIPTTFDEQNNPNTYCRQQGEAAYHTGDRYCSFSEPGTFVTGVSPSGNLICVSIDKACPNGEVITGYDPINAEFQCTRMSVLAAESYNCPSDGHVLVSTGTSFRCVDIATECGGNQIFTGFDSAGNPKCVNGSTALCPVGEFVNQVNPDGSVVCETRPAGLNFNLVAGEFLLGINPDGSPMRAGNDLSSITADGDAGCYGETEVLQWNAATNQFECYDMNGSINAPGDTLTQEEIFDFVYNRLRFDYRPITVTWAMTTGSGAQRTYTLPGEYSFCSLAGIEHEDEFRDDSTYGCWLNRTGRTFRVTLFRNDLRSLECRLNCLRRFK